MLSEQVDYGRLKELAAQQAQQTIGLPVDLLTRLASMLSSDAGSAGTVSGETGLETTLDFALGAEGLPQVGVKISGQLFLLCQRCLGPMAWDVDIHSKLTILAADEQAAQLQDPFDSIVIETDGLDMVQVIEDEILTALPLAPVHQNDPDCREIGADESNSENTAEPMQKPFAGLARLVSEGRKQADD